MAGLLTNDQELMDDIVRLLDFEDPLTPKMAIIGSTGGDMCITFPPDSEDDTDNAGLSSTSDDSFATDKRRSHKEKEKFRQRRYRQRIKRTRDTLRRQVNELSQQLKTLTKEAARKRNKITTAKIQATDSRWLKEVCLQRIQRLQSEAEQTQLISVMNSQAEYIKILRQMLHTQLRTNTPQADGFSRVTNVPTC